MMTQHDVIIWPIVKAPNGRFIIDHQKRLPNPFDVLISPEALIKIYHEGIEGRCKPKEIGPDVWKDWQVQLNHHLAGWMKMANKAGFVTTGFEKVKQCLADSPNVMLLLSEDTSEASISKLHLRHKPIAFMHKVSIMLLTSVFGSGLVKFIAIAPSSLCDRIEQGLIGCSILEKMRAQEALNVPKKSP